MNTYRVLRALGIIGAAWIIIGLVSGYMHLRDQMSDVLLSPASQEASIWGFFITGAIPYGIIALILVLPYRKFSMPIRVTCITLLCIAVGFVGWGFLRPFVTISGIHLHAMPLAAWLTLIGYITLIVSQIVAILWITKQGRTRRCS